MAGKAGRPRSPSAWPRTIKTGQFAGQTFEDQASFNRAMAASRKGADVPDKAPERAKPAAPARYQKGMIEALVTMMRGVTGFLPLFRENPITDEEYKWLVDDWFAFGKSNPFFAKLIVQLFAVDIYGKLIMDHVCIVGARMAGAGMLPPASVMPIQFAYIARQAMSGESVSFDDVGVAAGATPGADRSDGDRQDVPGPETFDSQAA